MTTINQYTIRLNDITTIDEVDFLWKKLYAHHHFLRHQIHIEPSDSDWVRRKNKLKDKACDLIVLTVKTELQLLGYLIASVHRLDPSVGEVESLYVEEEYRGEGLGTQLMHEAMSWFNYKNVKVRKLAVGIENETVVEFYRKQGFIPKSIILEMG
ncbi:GNAT family N-acetyltransferase [Flammeovirga sp. SubArs3]|uniref:GNAT family N-acetyltransferase n=1 Tax=Flammeovirga sp. SubArs3 TaxID=2995316 RepID=UPI00248B4275|nr:GNAT family N-acetyltransferase [Flammeovirga sp. SubArs3]